MTKPAPTKKHSKISKILLFPMLAMFFLVGWSFYWIGQKQIKQSRKTINKTKSKQKEELELTVISEEEQTPLLS
jgi:hypothetical protein